MSRKGESRKKSKSMLRQDVERRERAMARTSISNKRTPQEQLARLDATGFAAIKERLKLHMKINGV